MLGSWCAALRLGGGCGADAPARGAMINRVAGDGSWTAVGGSEGRSVGMHALAGDQSLGLAAHSCASQMGTAAPTQRGMGQKAGLLGYGDSVGQWRQACSGQMSQRRKGHQNRPPLSPAFLGLPCMSDNQGNRHDGGHSLRDRPSHPLPERHRDGCAARKWRGSGGDVTMGKPQTKERPRASVPTSVPVRRTSLFWFPNLGAASGVGVFMARDPPCARFFRPRVG